MSAQSTVLGWFGVPDVSAAQAASAKADLQLTDLNNQALAKGTITQAEHDLTTLHIQDSAIPNADQSVLSAGVRGIPLVGEGVANLAGLPPVPGEPPKPKSMPLWMKWAIGSTLAWMVFFLLIRKK